MASERTLRFGVVPASADAAFFFLGAGLWASQASAASQGQGFAVGSVQDIGKTRPMHNASRLSILLCSSTPLQVQTLTFTSSLRFRFSPGLIRFFQRDRIFARCRKGYSRQTPNRRVQGCLRWLRYVLRLDRRCINDAHGPVQGFLGAEFRVHVSACLCKRCSRLWPPFRYKE